jgi:hypothetical protein
MNDLPVVGQLEAEEKGRVVEILTAAFYDYPVSSCLEQVPGTLCHSELVRRNVKCLALLH